MALETTVNPTIIVTGFINVARERAAHASTPDGVVVAFSYPSPSVGTTPALFFSSSMHQYPNEPVPRPERRVKGMTASSRMQNRTHACHEGCWWWTRDDGASSASYCSFRDMWCSIDRQLPSNPHYSSVCSHHFLGANRVSRPQTSGFSDLSMYKQMAITYLLVWPFGGGRRCWRVPSKEVSRRTSRGIVRSNLSTFYHHSELQPPPRALPTPYLPRT
jgi:hypothetical protein